MNIKEYFQSRLLALLSRILLRGRAILEQRLSFLVGACVELQPAGIWVLLVKSRTGS